MLTNATRSPTLLACVAALLLPGAPCTADAGAPAARAQPWRDTYVTRLEALALLQSLNAELLSHDSATLTLDSWCATHKLAVPPRVTAERVREVDKPATPAQRALLGVTANEPLRYRRVRLHCGDKILSEADNWYVPARLTAEMNRALETSDIAFGRAVEALHFRRRTLAARLLWTVLPQGWETSVQPGGAATQALQIPAQVLQHTALLTLPDGTPISTVTETYTAEVLAFPEPPTP
jgi:chorismate-pyruvate lyase